ncbi:MAG: mandelate racemase/muconate lactonizing enzyme family protein [Bacteroidetes bacterium]|nr:mandelate racemase/muconate lactonizing enzyme family protein [Bacteroidota bacterium]
MKNTSRRSFISKTALAGAYGLMSCKRIQSDSPKNEANFKSRIHPLDGIPREKINITDVKVTLLSYETPREKQWIPSWIPPDYLWWKTDSIFVEVFTDQGITGIGGSSRYGGGIEETKRHIDSVIRPAIIGKNPWDMEFFAYKGENMLRRSAWAGVVSALWDIIGKACERPVYSLLATDNEPVTRIPCYASSGEVYENSVWPDDLISEALRHKEKGYLGFKFRTGIYWPYSKMTVSKFITYLEKLRNAVGPDFGLILEGNGLFSIQQSLEIAPALDELKFLWFEKPMTEEGPDAIDNYLKVKEALKTVKVSGLEKEMKIDKIMDWLETGAIDIIQPDCSIAGITESWYMARMAAIRNKQFCPHNYQCGFTTMQNAHLAAGNPNLLLLEICECYDPLREEVFKEPLLFKNGYIELSDKPGFGLEAAENLSSRFPYLPGPFQKKRT